MDGAADVEGHIVLAPMPIGVEQGLSPLWVVGGGRSASRHDVPLSPGDYSYPLVSDDEALVFTDLQTVYVLDAGLAGPPVSRARGSFLVPGARQGIAWVAGESSTSLAQVDLPDGLVHSPIDVIGVVSWPYVGVADGLLIRPVQEDQYGPVAYWSPATGISRLPTKVANLQLLTATGDLAVFSSPDGAVTVFDVRRMRHVSRFTAGSELVGDVRACVSPNGDFIAIVLPDGTAEVRDMRSGAQVAEYQAAPFGGLGWTADQSLVYTTTTTGIGTVVQLLDVNTGQSHSVASVSWSNGWLTTSATTC